MHWLLPDENFSMKWKLAPVAPFKGVFPFTVSFPVRLQFTSSKHMLQTFLSDLFLPKDTKKKTTFLSQCTSCMHKVNCFRFICRLKMDESHNKLDIVDLKVISNWKQSRATRTKHPFDWLKRRCDWKLSCRKITWNHYEKLQLRIFS